MKSEKTDEVKKLARDIGLTVVQQEAVAKYLGARFSQYGVKWYSLKYELTPRYTYAATFTQDIPVTQQSLGIFYHAIKQCTFVAEVWISEKENAPIYVNTGVRYELIALGSNGNELNCKIVVGTTGEITEVYR